MLYKPRNKSHNKHPNPILNPKPQHYRGVFAMQSTIHTAGLEQVKDNVLAGTSNWAAKVAITGMLYIMAYYIVLQCILL